MAGAYQNQVHKVNAFSRRAAAQVEAQVWRIVQ